MYVIVDDGIVKTVGVDINQFPQAIEAPDDILFGDAYINGEFQKTALRIIKTPELRKQEILWELEQLDNVVSRVSEEIIEKSCITIYQKYQDVINRKKELRIELNSL